MQFSHCFHCVLAMTLGTNAQLRIAREKEGQRIERPSPGTPYDSKSERNSTLFMLDALNMGEHTLAAAFLERAPSSPLALPTRRGRDCPGPQRRAPPLRCFADPAAPPVLAGPDRLGSHP